MAVIYGGIPTLPKTIPGLQLWLDANVGLFDNTIGGNLVTSDSASVGRWEDQSGNGRHISQSILGSRPILKTRQQNDRNILRFDGLDDHLFMLSAFIYAAGASTIFCVVSSTSAANTIFMAERSSLTSTPNYIVLSNGSATSTRLRTFMRDDSNVTILNFQTIGSDVAFDGTFRLIGKVDTGSNVTLYANKIALINSNYTRTSLTLDRFCIGATRTSSASAFFACDLGEVIIYNSVLSSVDRQKIENYLYKKWAIT